MPEIAKAAYMNRFKHLIKAAAAIALTYVLCASALLQPMAVYAATLLRCKLSSLLPRQLTHPVHRIALPGTCLMTQPMG